MIGGNSGVTAVDIAPLLQAGAHIIAVIILTALAAWLRAHVADQAARQTILTAVENGISYAENHFGATSGKPYNINLAAGIGTTAFRYVTQMVPEAVKRMGLDDQALARLVVAKMPGIDRTALDPSTVDQITAAASGKAPATPSLDDLSKVIIPMVKQAVDSALEAHYAVKDPGSGNT